MKHHIISLSIIHTLQPKTDDEDTSILILERHLAAPPNYNEEPTQEEAPRHIMQEEEITPTITPSITPSSVPTLQTTEPTFMPSVAPSDTNYPTANPSPALTLLTQSSITAAVAASAGAAAAVASASSSASAAAAASSSSAAAGSASASSAAAGSAGTSSASSAAAGAPKSSAGVAMSQQGGDVSTSKDKELKGGFIGLGAEAGATLAEFSCGIMNGRESESHTTCNDAV